MPCHLFLICLIVSCRLRGKSHVLSRAGEAQEGEGGVEKESWQVGRPSVCPSGKQPLIREDIPAAEVVAHLTGLISDRAALSVSSTWMRPTLLWNQRLVSPISSTWRRSKSKSWKNKVSRHGPEVVPPSEDCPTTSEGFFFFNICTRILLDR